MGRKSAYLERFDVQVREWRGRLDLMATGASKEVRARIRALLEDCHAVEQRLHELHDASDWEPLVEEIEETCRRIEAGIDDIRDKLVA